MLRPAVAADLPALSAIRDRAGVDALCDPAPLTDARLRDMIAAGAVAAWEADGGVAGFAARDGAAIHLLVDPAQRSKGIGRALLEAACERVTAAGYGSARVHLAPGSSAERHYRTAGWTVAGTTVAGGTILAKKL